MVRVVQISQAELLANYAAGAGWDWLTVKVGTEQRVYYRTYRFPCRADEEYVVVYAVVS